MKNVTIIDYGLGNLLSVAKAFEFCGANVLFAENCDAINRADYLVLPGVGAFANGMAELEKRNLISAIKEYAKTDRPLLGICLGMQMMLSQAEEFGRHNGLGIIPGKVQHIPIQISKEESRKVPHIGWNKINVVTSGEKVFSPMLVSQPAFYFVHSYHVLPERNEDIFATCEYDGLELVAMVKHKNIIGCQFHPEKSAAIGLALLDQFMKI